MPVFRSQKHTHNIYLKYYKYKMGCTRVLQLRSGGSIRELEKYMGASIPHMAKVL